MGSRVYFGLVLLSMIPLSEFIKRGIWMEKFNEQLVLQTLTDNYYQLNKLEGVVFQLIDRLRN